MYAEVYRNIITDNKIQAQEAEQYMSYSKIRIATVNGHKYSQKKAKL